ncbi:MAG: hypothetical protein IT436_05180 [Phycisphaerales bacterium]|nr:hypothetical protein [Phycisphaerales bacterium]
MPRQVPYIYTMDFSAIAALGQQVRSALVDSDCLGFVIERMRAVFWNDALVGTTIAGTPLGLIGDMSPAAGVGNIWFNHYQIGVKLGTTSDPWTKSQVRVPLIFDVGQMDRPAILQRRIDPGTTLQADVQSFANTAVSGQFAFIGYKEYR